MITLNDFKLARERIKGVAVHTPLILYPHLSSATQKGSVRHEPLATCQLFFKPESLQPIGAFKIRGAYNKIASLPEEERKRGVITYSSGNHAQGVAYAARALGVKAVVVMPNNAPKTKIGATRALGAEVVFVGPASSERQEKAEELAAQHGYTMVPPYDDEKIVAGQGTVALEILEDLPEVECILSPVSGGGLLSGIATAVKLSRPDVKVIGCEPELAADAQESLRTGKLVTWPAEKTTRTICDGLRTQSLGNINFALIRKYVDDIVTVTEDEIREAMRRLALDAKLVAEPSGAVTFAAFLFHAGQLPPSRRTVAVISGGNVEPEFLADVLRSRDRTIE